MARGRISESFIMEIYKKLLLSNKAWVEDRLKIKSDYFKDMLKPQTPEFLWIGCSDSRVPAEEIAGTKPGDLFVHRNVGNLVVPFDTNALSVVQYSVEVLKVNHIIVCGHYGCGGVQAAMSNQKFGFIDKWLQNIKDVIARHADELNAIEDPQKKFDRVIELNVMQQVHYLAKSIFVKNAWAERKAPIIHGWVYDLGNGYIKDLFMIRSNDPYETKIQEWLKQDPARLDHQA